MKDKNKEQIYTIQDFCKKCSLSEGMYYKLQRQGLAPDRIKIGRRTLITQAAVDKWLKQIAMKGGQK